MSLAVCLSVPCRAEQGNRRKTVSSVLAFPLLLQKSTNTQADGKGANRDEAGASQGEEAGHVPAFAERI
jgi:hypothetical protein